MAIVALLATAASAQAAVPRPLSASPFVLGGSAPTISALSSHEAWSTGEKEIYVFGSELEEIVEVTVGDRSAEWEEVGPHEFYFLVPREDRFAEEAGGEVRVSVTTENGTDEPDLGGEDMLRYIPPVEPTVTHVEPKSGPAAGGTRVFVKGQGFTQGGEEEQETVYDVWFGSKQASGIRVESSTELSALSPPSARAGTVDVTVQTVAGRSPVNASDDFTYGSGAVPTVEQVLPHEGPEAGHNIVEIRGEHLGEAESVRFGGKAATIVLDEPGKVRAEAPPAAAGTVDVTVTTPTGTSAITSADHYTYLPAAKPTVTQITPSSGPASGGTTVFISGTGFENTDTVKFGSTAATNFQFINTKEVSVTSPAGAETVDVRVAGVGGTSATGEADRFSYAPVVTGVSPNSGPQGGGQKIKITGAGMSFVTSVQVGTKEAFNVKVESEKEVTASVPTPTEAGTFDVTVHAVTGTSATSPADLYTYKPRPVVTGVTPASGPDYGGDTVTITGSHFGGAEKVILGSHLSQVELTSFKLESENTIVFTTPAWFDDETVDIEVSSPGGGSAASSADQYSYRPLPQVGAMSSHEGPLAGGEKVSIFGNHLASATAVDFGAVAASFEVIGNKLVATVPPGTGTVDVTVTTPEGTSRTASADEYTYLSAPVITGISPDHLLIGSGTRQITVSGQNLKGVLSATEQPVGHELVVTEDTDTSLVLETDSAYAPGTSELVIQTAQGSAAATFAWERPEDTFPVFGRCAKLGTRTGGYSDKKCTEPASGSTGKYQWSAGFASPALTISGGALTLTGAGATITCTSVTGEGEETGPAELSEVSLQLHGCKSGSEQCSSGATAGEIDSAPLAGLLGWQFTPPKGGQVAAFALLPTVFGGDVASFTCGSQAIALLGGVATTVKAGKTATSLPLKYKAKKGSQAVLGLRHAITQPQVRVDGGEAKPAGISTTLALSAAEAFEVNPVL